MRGGGFEKRSSASSSLQAVHVGYKVSRAVGAGEKTGRSVFRDASRLPEQFRAAGVFKNEV